MNLSVRERCEVYRKNGKLVKTMKSSNKQKTPVIKLTILLALLSFSLSNPLTYAASENNNVIGQMNAMIA